MVATKSKKNETNIIVSYDRITGTILGKPISDNGDRPMFFENHIPKDISNWTTGFRIGTTDKSYNCNVDGSITICKNGIYYLHNKPMSFLCYAYSPKSDNWSAKGYFIGNRYPYELKAQYNELMLYTKPISEKEVLKMITPSKVEDIISYVEKEFSKLSQADREVLSIKLFKLVKDYV